MSLFERLLDAGASHTKIAILLMVLLTAGIGTGIPEVDQASSLDQFQTDSAASEKLDYIERNFQADGENTTTLQLIIRGQRDDVNVLERSALLESLRFQRELVTNDSVGPTLSDERPTFGIANVVAIRALVNRERGELRTLVERARRLNETIRTERAALEQNRTEFAARRAVLNETGDALEDALDGLRANPDADVRAAFDRVNRSSPVVLDDEQFRTFEVAAGQLRSAENETEVRNAYQLGTRGVLEPEFATLAERGDALEERAAVLEDRGQQLRNLSSEIEAQQRTLRNATSASLEEQIDVLDSMNDSAAESLVEQSLSEGGNEVFGLLPTEGYAPGSTSAEATLVVVRQVTESGTQVSGTAPEGIVDSQLLVQSMAKDRSGNLEYLVFGAGIVSEEIDSSMADSLLIVAPLALVFVLVTLLIAYRDLLDIVLGLFGITSVLVWTFGFMGWAGISFNQIFIAVPVLLIGLSIDYAIHIFMRHREERVESDGLGSRPSMRIALGGVGIALIWVTATTVIGFLSNLISPVPPIREFGLVSAFGITAALLVFGVLIPSLKVELDELLERFGFDREKRAFGTGGGRFSDALAVGATAARRSPRAVILAVVLVSAVGGVGATQIDTSFEQEDFLAEDPADWMKELPEPFAPNTYTVKTNLEYVNERFGRENARGQLLLEDDVATPEALAKVDTVATQARENSVTQILSNDEADITSPLSALESVAARNETMNATLRAADTDGDGVPDRNVREVYDTLYAVAPSEAANVIHREDGEYRALRVVISTRGDASNEDVRRQMEDLAASIDGDGITVTATGSIILNEIVSDQLLDTVIESLLITLVAIFLFLMAIYRITDGSASLGAVTLLPVVFSLAWILGTMTLLGIPFNVVTGLITSLTIGLGVAYSIHISERYNQELERSADVWEAMRTAVTGTGGALLGSAATTVGGFGVLGFAILPPLQQFGIITGMTIVYAFLAAVIVLPSLLVVWTRYLGPDVDGLETPTATDEPAPESVETTASSDTTTSGSVASEPESATGTEEATAQEEDTFAADGFIPATEYRDRLDED